MSAQRRKKNHGRHLCGFIYVLKVIDVFCWFDLSSLKFRDDREHFACRLWFKVTLFIGSYFSRGSTHVDDYGFSTCGAPPGLASAQPHLVAVKYVAHPPT